MKFKDFIMNVVDNMEQANSGPKTFKDIMIHPDKDGWLETMGH